MAAPPTHHAPPRSVALASQQLEHKQQTTSLTIKEDKLVMEEIKKLSSGKVACLGCQGGRGRSAVFPGPVARCPWSCGEVQCRTKAVQGGQ